MKHLVIAVLILLLLGGVVFSQKKSQPVKTAKPATAAPARMYPAVETEVLRLLDDYMEAWNKKDLEAWERTFHFPHYRLASGNMSVLDRPGLQDAERIWQGSIESDWHHSAWDHRRMIHISSDKVHVDTRFTRYRSDGTKINSYNSLYIVTKENGRWGVKLRSSFAK